MKKRALAILLTLCMVVGLLPTVAFAEGEGIDWTASEITISTAKDFVAFEQYVNAGHTMEKQTVKLGADIDLSGIEWKPIGNVTAYPSVTFYGTFDGDGHTISNMTTSDTTANYASAGLFGSLMGTIKNVTLTNVDVTSSHYAGAICGYSSCNMGCTIENCTVKGGKITSTPEASGNGYDNGDKVGGIIGYIVNDVKVTGCTVEDLEIAAYRDVGGIVGCATGGAAAGVTDCTVNNISVIAGAEEELNYKNFKTAADYNADELIGRKDLAVPDSNTAQGTTISYVPAVAKIDDVEYFTLAEAVAAVQDGETIEIVKAKDFGPTSFPRNNGISYTVKGAVKGVEIGSTTASAGYQYCIDNGHVNFENVTVKASKANYQYFRNVSFEDCTLIGNLCLSGNTDFTDCTFYAPGTTESGITGADYSAWCYGDNATFTGCTFNGAGKFLNIYCEGNSETYTITLNDCAFVNTGDANKAPLNIKETSGSNLLKYRVIAKNCTTEGAFPEASGNVNSSLVVFDGGLAQVDARTEASIANSGENKGVMLWVDDELIYPFTTYTVKYTFDDEPAAEDSDFKEQTCIAAGSAGILAEVKDTVSYNGKTYALDSVTNEESVVTIRYALDVIGAEDENGNSIGDGIADKCQKVVTYKVENGTWDGTDDADKTEIVILMKDGKPSVDGTADLNVPSVADKSGYTGKWDPEIPDAFNKDSKVEYTYKFTKNSSSGGSSGGDITIEDEKTPLAGLNKVNHTAYITGYADGTVRPLNNITRAEVAAIFFRLLDDETREANMSFANKYTDVDDTYWCNAAISTLSKMGIITGFPDGTFRPTNEITRAQFVTIAVRFFDVANTPDTDAFTDISDHWARNYINQAYAINLTRGYADGTFRPTDKITRAEAITIVNRSMNREPAIESLLPEQMTTWIDNMDTNAWYYVAIQEAGNSHLYEADKENNEMWTSVREPEDWAALQAEWIRQAQEKAAE